MIVEEFGFCVEGHSQFGEHGGERMDDEVMIGTQYLFNNIA